MIYACFNGFTVENLNILHDFYSFVIEAIWYSYNLKTIHILLYMENKCSMGGNIKSVITSFIETLANSNLADVSIDLIENVVDKNICNEIVKDVPIINSLVGIVQTTQSISNYLFLRKIAAFMLKIKDISPLKRDKAIKRIEESGKYREKVGVTLLSIIDKCESVDKAEYIAILFRAFLKDDITYECFRYGSHIIQRTFFDDFREFVYSDDTWKMSEDAIDDINSGLYYLDITLNLYEYRSAILGTKKDFTLHDVGANISDIGVTLRSIFQDAIEAGLIE